MIVFVRIIFDISLYFISCSICTWRLYPIYDDNNNDYSLYGFKIHSLAYQIQLQAAANFKMPLRAVNLKWNSYISYFFYWLKKKQKKKYHLKKKTNIAKQTSTKHIYIYISLYFFVCFSPHIQPPTTTTTKKKKPTKPTKNL